MSLKLTFLYSLFSKIKNIILTLIPIKTVGARALVIRGEEILLVKHTYQKGWYTIGGAVEKGESPLEAIVRELWEEVGIKTVQPELMGVYHNNREKWDDYVALYVVKDFMMKESQCDEILDKQWFKITLLPPDTTPATRRRVEEYLKLRKQSDKW